ncbi:hypothetical protein QEK78_004588 [Stenotrophomonas maltophilia]|nr:hypothetical protein [Stenotrophomonas maltophilia]EKU9978677.1 hypothetical protein [Stenotrophomonas maltophilia]
MNQKIRLGSLSVLLSLLGSGLLISPAQAVDAPPAMGQDTGLDILLTQKARDILERVRLVDGQARSHRVEVSADIANGVVTVALDRVFLPADYGPSFEDQRSEISFGLLHWAEQAAPFSRVVFLYDGKEIEYYFPEIKAADDAAREAGEALRRMRGATGSGIELGYAGNPQYPLSVELSLASCSEEGACTPSATTFDDPAKPLTINLACNGPDPGVARWSAVLRDADGVATAPVEFSQACVRA